MNFNRDKSTTTPLTEQNLNGVSSKSNLGHYLAKDQNFEKVRILMVPNNGHAFLQRIGRDFQLRMGEMSPFPWQ
ncbi:hypothetical protein V2G26_001486 [Clonostachys chloroleuca]